MASDKKYNKLISLIDLKNIELSSVTCEKNGKFSFATSPLNVGIQYNSSEVNQISADITIPFKLRVVAFFSEDDDLSSEDVENLPEEHVCFRIELEFALSYSLEDSSDETNVIEDFSDVLEQFAHLNVPVNAWPYARELVSNLTTRMQLPPVIMPPFKTSNR